MEFFVAKILDERMRRVVIDVDVWNRLQLKRGDYVKITIEKIEE